MLKESAARAGVGRSQRFARSLLVVAQVAVACALLVGSGLALRAFQAVAETPLGFDTENLAVARISLPESKYTDDDRVLAFYRSVLGKLAALPGVQAVAANAELPLGGRNNNGSFKIEGHAAWPRGDQPNLGRNSVTPGYFAAMGIPLLRGREFTDADRKGGRPVMIINQATAERYFPGEDAIGHRMDRVPRTGKRT